MRFDTLYWNSVGKVEPYFSRQTRDKLTFTTLGPENLYDASTGLDKVLWTFTVEGNSVYVEKTGVKVKLFDEAGSIAEITGTFDQLGFPVIFYRLEGSVVECDYPEYNIFNEGELKVYWYDTVAGAVKLDRIGVGRCPFVVFDMLYLSSSGYSDYVLFYIEENTLKFRVQRERLAIVRTIPVEIEWNDLLDYVEMGSNFHLQVSLKRVSWNKEDLTGWEAEGKASGTWVENIVRKTISKEESYFNFAVGGVDLRAYLREGTSSEKLGSSFAVSLANSKIIAKFADSKETAQIGFSITDAESTSLLVETDSDTAANFVFNISTANIYGKGDTHKTFAFSTGFEFGLAKVSLKDNSEHDTEATLFTGFNFGLNSVELNKFIISAFSKESVGFSPTVVKVRLGTGADKQFELSEKVGYSFNIMSVNLFKFSVAYYEPAEFINFNFGIVEASLYA